MRAPEKPRDEAERLAALESYELLDTLPEQCYQDIVTLAARICDVPIALVSLVDTDRQWFKARHGLEATETPRDVSFCGHAVVAGETLVVPDAHDDSRFADNPLVIGAPEVRFYAGAPLTTEAGYSLGTLCVIDHKPRDLAGDKLGELEALARLTVALFERRRVEADQRVTAASLNSARAQHERFFDVSPDLLCVVNFDGTFAEVNPAWSTALGYAPDELLGRQFLSIIHADDRPATLSAALAFTKRDHEIVKFENRCINASGDSRWLRWSIAHDAVNDRVLASARDVTEEKRTAVALSTAVEQAQGANRAKSAFLASMSHELRTPLNSVIGFTNLLAKNKRGALVADELTYLERINANGRHLLDLINDVLDISRIEGDALALEAVAFDLGALINETLSELHGAISESGNGLRVDVRVGLQPLVADRKRLKQVLINLVGNANKFTDDGTIEISVYDVAGVPKRIDVRDNGPGISDDDLGAIFEAFKQVEGGHSRPFGGTGLGLTISKSLADAMGFEIGVASDVGKGSTFYVRLSDDAPAGTHVTPGESGRFQSLGTGAVPTVPPDRNAGTVLIIDDDSDARLLLAKIVEDVGASVVTADGAMQGLAIARAVRPSLIVLDLSMPAMDGQDALARLAADDTTRDIPVIICSSARGGNLPGAVARLSKPLDRSEFASALRASLGAAIDVLVVEDDPDTRELLKAIVEDTGATVRMACDGREALAALEVRKPDLVILDLHMPDVDGFEFLRKLRARPDGNELEVLVCTASELDPSETEFLRISAGTVIQKGESLGDEIVARMQKLLGTGG